MRATPKMPPLVVMHTLMNNPFRKRNSFFRQDRIAMRLAARYRMTYEYKLARRHGLTPKEALEDWDLMKKEDYQVFEK